MPPSDLGSQTPRFDSGYPSPRATRSPSVSSDIPSSVATHGGLLSPPSSVSPDAAFIAVSAASQIVTNDHDSQSEAWLDQHGIEPSGETALVSPPALKLVNRFLDQLLFNFLSLSRSTALSALRPAVSEVLKPKLARGAISGADSELHEYLGGEEEEDLLALQNGVSRSKDWDLELVWKRTRLRCMVYSSLGDMEEEEEDFYTEQEELDSTGSSQTQGVVSPAVAIFLTSILEFMGEQVLVVAGQAAYHRLRLKHERDEKDGRSTPEDIAERVVVEEADMERVALDRTLGRLWRGWKKRIRSPIGSVSMAPRPFSRESTRSQPRTVAAPSAPGEQIDKDLQETILTDHEHAALIPLPSTEDDVREIEIPGLAQEFDDEDEAVDEDEADQLPARPISFQFWSHPTQDLHAPAPSDIHMPKFITAASRKRSYSSPTAVTKRPKPYIDDPSEDQEDVKGAEPVVANEGSVESSQEVDEDDGHPKLPERSPARRGIMMGGAGAAAVAAAVAAEVKAREAESGHEEVDSEEELHEEPQIMTSSRVSIGGRISPEDNPAPSKRSSVRSHSVHSLRLIEVSSPKSPARSRGTSFDASEYPPNGRPIVVTTPGSIVSPLLATSHVSSPVSQVRTASPISRNASSNSSRHLGNSTTDSISEAEEQEAPANELGPDRALPSHFAAAMQGVDVWHAPGPQYTSAPANREVKAQPSPFVLSPAPATRNARGNTSAPVQDFPSNQQNSGLAVKPRGEHGVAPPLTPLREMMEGAPDTSDEASSVAPSYDGQSYSERTLDGHSPSVSAGSLIQRSVRPHAPSLPRGSPPRSSREEPSRKDYRAQRPIHTSGSGSSSVSHKFKAVRSSEDSAPSVIEDKSKTFEQLIRSDQTIQYTLTPANMRDITAPDSPHSPRLIASPIRANFPSFPESPRPATGRSHSSSVGKYGKPTAIEASQPFKNPKATNGGSKLALNTGPGPRTTSYQPRDARVEAESIEDFAEFIKATGPPAATRYETGPRSAPPVEAPRFPGPSRKFSATDSSIGIATSLPRRADSSAGRTKLQARDAVVTRADGINDLIDFMRSGPEGESEPPRTLRRAATDSDYLTDSFGGAGDARYSQTPTSVHSSVTSQSALLNGSSKMNRPLPAQNNRDLDEEDMMPKRKTRRVRDMYQIDFSDEEEEYEAVAGRPQPIQEESLADFLRNVPPPPESTVAPVFETAPVSSNKIKRKSSTTGIMSRFSRNSQQVLTKPRTGGQDARPGSRADTATPSHTPIAVQFQSSYRTSSSDGPRAGNNAPRIDAPRTKVAQKTYQPRDAVYSTSRTNELAAFLRDSDPPSAMHAQPQTFPPTLQKDEASTFQRVFGRRKVQ